MNKPQLRIHTLNEKESTSYICEEHLEIFKSNPFHLPNSPVMIRYEDNSTTVGSVFVFPLEIIYGDSIFRVCAGSTLTVDERYRGRGFAKQMTLKRLELSEDKIAIASGLSNMSLPLFKKIGFAVFPLERYIFVVNSYPAIKKFVGDNCASKALSSFINVFANTWLSIIRMRNRQMLKDYQVEEVKDTPQEVADIAREESCQFMENHTREWFNWVLHGHFNKGERNKQHLFVVKDKTDIVAFYMTKERYHEQASHRGFRDVMLGSVIEWGVRRDSHLNESDVLLNAVLSFEESVDVVEVCSADKNLNKSLKRNMMIHLGDSNFAIFAKEGTELAKTNDYRNPANWRIRPAGSDNSFN